MRVHSPQVASQNSCKAPWASWWAIIWPIIEMAIMKATNLWKATSLSTEKKRVMMTWKTHRHTSPILTCGAVVDPTSSKTTCLWTRTANCSSDKNMLRVYVLKSQSHENIKLAGQSSWKCDEKVLPRKCFPHFSSRNLWLVPKPTGLVSRSQFCLLNYTAVFETVRSYQLKKNYKSTNKSIQDFLAWK